MENDENLIEVEKLKYRPFTKFCMSIGAVPSSYLASMTLPEQILWLSSYVEKQVIPAVNNNAEAVEELQDLYVELHDYVEHYFDNLNVQQEINNKLDEMAEDGTLTTLIGNYVQPLIDNQNAIIANQTQTIQGLQTNVNTFEDSVNDTLNLLNVKINAIPSGNPIAVSSTSAMTDTTKIYVLTTNGYWYYYNGTSFVQGGVYQSSSIDDVIDDLKYRDDARVNAILNGDIKLYKGPSSPGQISDSTGEYSTKISTDLQASPYYIPVEIGKTYRVTIATNGPLYNIYYYDANKQFIGSQFPNNAMVTTQTVFTNSNYGYIRIGSWKSGNSPLVFEERIIISEVTDFIPLNTQRKGMIVSSGAININTSSGKLITGSNTYIICGNGLNYDISNKEYDISSYLSSGGWCRYNYQTDTIDRSPSETTISIGAIWNNGAKIDLFVQDNSTLLIDGIPYQVSSEYIDKNLLCLGDSMTYGTGTTTIYYQYLNRNLGKFTTTNYGVGGSSITPKTGDFPEWDTAESFLERYSSMSNNGDVIIVFGGVNDWVTGRALGTMSSTDTYTFYGAMKSLCDGLIDKYPNKQIVFFTSPQNDYVYRKASIPEDNQYYNNVDGYNRLGLKLEDYTKAMKEVCDVYGIPCDRLDTKCWYGLSGQLQDGTISSDGLHPNANGHKIIAKNMANFIKNNR